MKFLNSKFTLNAIAIGLLWWSFTTEAQDLSGQCVAFDRLVSARQNLMEVYTRYQGHLQEWNETASTRLEAIKSLEECWENSSLIGDITSTLTFQETDCNKIISEHNLLLARENSLKQVLSSESTIIRMMAASIKVGESRVCK